MEKKQNRPQPGLVASFDIRAGNGVGVFSKDKGKK